MQPFESGEVALGEPVQHFIEDAAVVGMGKAVTIQHHIDPYLTVIDESGLEGFFNHVAWGDRIYNYTVFFHIVFERLPGKLEGELEALDRPFPLQLGKAVEPGIPDLAQQNECPVEIVETLLPAGICHRNLLSVSER